MKPVALIARCLLAVCAAAPLAARGWDPYDTDSSRSRGYGEDYDSPGYYGTPAVPPGRGRPGAAPTEPDYGWGTGSGAADYRDDWGNSNWYATDPRRSRDAWSSVPPVPAGETDSWSPAYRGQRASEPPAYADPWRYRPGEPMEEASPQAWDDAAGGRYRQPSDDGDWRLPARQRYRFREDPELDALSGQGRTREGYRYRPLTERELERQRRRGGDQYPEFRPRDLQPRGPWRSYEDEGTAFGYHPDADNFQRPEWSPW